MPGLAILVVSLAFNLLGDGLRDVLDPRADSMTAQLVVEDLRVRFHTARRVVEAVRGVSFTVGRERLGIVGESGSGKSRPGARSCGSRRRRRRSRAKTLQFQEIDLLRRTERQC